MLKLALERGQHFLLGGQNSLEVPFQAERFIEYRCKGEEAFLGFRERLLQLGWEWGGREPGAQT